MHDQSHDGHVPVLEPSSVLVGFHETYRRLGVSAESAFQAAAHAFAITELLIAKGLIGVEELGDRQRKVEERLRANLAEAGMMVQLADEPDKYAMGETAEIDCHSRLPLCRAACCRLRFALSEQDIHEGVVQWEITQPYLNRQGADGYCVHCNSETRACTVYERRPSICRRYDCRQDKRIWLDFEQRVINPELFAGEAPGDAQPARTSEVPVTPA
jgi:Fe-S-cluster containining protein